MVTPVIVSRHDAHPITFLLQIATLPHLCCSTTPSVVCCSTVGLGMLLQGYALSPPQPTRKFLPDVGGGGTLPQCFAPTQAMWQGPLCAGATWLSSWAAMGAVLILCMIPQDQCWPNSSPHQALIAVWPMCRVGPPTQPVWGHCIAGLHVLHGLQVGEN